MIALNLLLKCALEQEFRSYRHKLYTTVVTFQSKSYRQLKMVSRVRVRPISRRIIVLALLLLCLLIRLQQKIATDSGIQVPVFPFNSVPFFVLKLRSALLRASKSSHYHHGSLLLVSFRRTSSVLLITTPFACVVA